MPIDPQAVVPFASPGVVEYIDISTGFLDTDFISVAMPDFPLYSLDVTQTFIDFTSNDSGDFTAGPTASIPFSSSTVTLVNGDSELRFPRSLITGINLASMTGVRFRIYAKSACTFRCLSIRLVSANWTYAPIDLDTLFRKAERPVPPNGALTPQYTFPTQSDPNIPAEWPILYRADDPPGVTDPRPINSEVTAWFHSGSLTAGSGDTGGATLFNTGENTVGDIVALRYTTALTLEIWVKPTTLSSDTMFGLFTKYQDAVGQRGYRLGITPAGELRFDLSGDGTAVTTVTTSGAAIPINQWTHIAVTFQGGATNQGLPLLLNTQGGQVAFYKNGALILSRGGLPQSIFQTTQPFKIGAWDSSL